MLIVHFHLQRHMGNFLIQVYGPCCLLVILSWVSFWLNREATADRISLGITTVLTMTFLGLEARTDLPKVPYLTALDFFVFLSFAFIFATILQFAIVHYFTKYGSGECYFIIDQFDSESDSDDNDDETTTLHTLEHHTISSIRTTTTIDLDSTTDESKIFEVIPLSECSIPPTLSITPEHEKCRRKKSSKSSKWLQWNCFKRKNKTGCSNSINEETTRSSNFSFLKISFRKLKYYLICGSLIFL